MRLSRRETRVMGLLLLLLIISVGYAFLSQSLNITGTSQITKATWKIIWDNVQVNNQSVSGVNVTQAAHIKNPDKTIVEYDIFLEKPGDFYEFTIVAKNEGTIDGMVNVISNKVYESNGITERELPNYLSYSVTYSDGESIAPYQLLKADTTEIYKVRVEFKDVTAEQLPSVEETIKFVFSVDYVQASEQAQEVVHRLTGTRYTVNLYQENPDAGEGENSAIWIGKKTTDNITLYETANEAKVAFNNKPFYLKHVIESDIVKESYVCFEKDGNTYCLRGQQTYEEVNDSWQCKSEFFDSATNKCISTYYESNKTILIQAFGESNCTDYSSYFNCSVASLYADVDEDGYAITVSGSANCHIHGDGRSHCHE